MKEGEKRGENTFLAPERQLCFGSGGEVIADSNHWGGWETWSDTMQLDCWFLLVNRTFLNPFIAL